MPLTRRQFCVTATASATAPLFAQNTGRINVAAVDRQRILAEAEAALKLPPRPLTAIKARTPEAHPQDFASDPELLPTTPAKPFRAHAEALFDASATIAALTAAFIVTSESRFALHAGKHLYAWFVDPATSVSAAMPTVTAPGSVTDLAPLAEIARALPFLIDTAALYPPDLATAQAWFRDFLTWLSTARPALIAREARDHAASAHLLLTAACARLLRDEGELTTARNRLKRPTLRNQISATGEFPHEVATPYPLRNTLLNADLLTCACELLSTPFFSLWTFELEDGPGIRVAAAFLFPILQDPSRWIYPADATHYRDVPRRRMALLLAGRAYNRPEYVDLWRTLPAPLYPAPSGTEPEPFRTSQPIRQPLLWTTRAPHGA